jgi:hypothetical protein
MIHVSNHRYYSPISSSSPSIYVAFNSLHVTDLCEDIGPKGGSITMAFDPNELSTTIGYIWNATVFTNEPWFSGQVFTQASWGDQ